MGAGRWYFDITMFYPCSKDNDDLHLFLIEYCEICNMGFAWKHCSDHTASFRY